MTDAAGRAKNKENRTVKRTKAELEAENRKLKRLLASLRMTPEQRDYYEELAHHFKQQPFSPVDLYRFQGADKDEAVAFMAESGRNSTENTVWGIQMIDADGSVASTAMTGNGRRSEYHARLYAGLHNFTPFLIEHLLAVYTAAGEGLE